VDVRRCVGERVTHCVGVGLDAVGQNIGLCIRDLELGGWRRNRAASHGVRELDYVVLWLDRGSSRDGDFQGVCGIGDDNAGNRCRLTFQQGSKSGGIGVRTVGQDVLLVFKAQRFGIAAGIGMMR
jgi:hypothetical protein